MALGRVELCLACSGVPGTVSCLWTAASRLLSRPASRRVSVCVFVCRCDFTGFSLGWRDRDFCFRGSRFLKEYLDSCRIRAA